MTEPDERAVFAALDTEPDPGVAQGLLERLLDEITDAPSNPSQRSVASTGEATEGSEEDLLMVNIETKDQTNQRPRSMNRKWIGWAAVAAAALVVVVIVATNDSDDGVIASSQDPQVVADEAIIESSEDPQVVAAEAVIGMWDFTDELDSHLQMEFETDGSFAIWLPAEPNSTTEHTGRADVGEYLIEGDVIILESGASNACPKPPVEGVHGDGKTGQYRMVFEGPDFLDLQLIDDECGNRLGSLERSDLVRTSG